MDVLSEVDEEEIAEVLAAWTGIPVYKLTEEETEKLLRMEDELHKRIVDQSEAVTAVSKSIRRTRAGLKDPKRPSGSFIFLGPSGVGKTELSKALAEFLFGDEDALIQLDMSEYMEKHTVSRADRLPARLRRATRRAASSPRRCAASRSRVVLFDEIEKAHPDVFNMLLQILEDGRLTDAQGHAVDFKNTVIIMTSNLGTRDIQKGPGIGFAAGGRRAVTLRQDEGQGHGGAQALLPARVPEPDRRGHRVPLADAENVKDIVDLMMKRVREQLKAKDVDIELTDAAKDAARGEGLRPGPRRPAAAPDDPAPGRGPPVREAPVEGVQGRADDHRGRRGRRDRVRGAPVPPDIPPVELAGQES